VVFGTRPLTLASPEFSIREATEGDLEAVSKIKVRSWAETYGPLLDPEVLSPFLDQPAQLATLRKQLPEPKTLLLVAHDRSGVVVAFALTHLANDPEPLLESLHVASQVQGHGVGTVLMRATALGLKGRGYDTMRLGVIVGNTTAARFYDRLGGTLIGVEPVSWAAGVSHMVYRWPDLAPLI
jgi:ribosomal protein S18 acetylase RimI-like enzyme